MGDYREGVMSVSGRSRRKVLSGTMVVALLVTLAAVVWLGPTSGAHATSSSPIILSRQSVTHSPDGAESVFWRGTGAWIGPSPLPT